MDIAYLFKSVLRSFYSKEFYREVGTKWQGFGFGYLFFVISVFSLPLALAAVIYSSTITLDEPFDFNYMINQVPQITIKNGEISTEAAMPYYIKDKTTGDPVIIIDTTRPVTDWSQSMNDGKAPIVIGKNQILMTRNSSSSEKRLYDVSKDVDMVVTSSTAREYAETIVNYAWVAVIFMALIFIAVFFIARIIAMFFYGLLAKVISLILRAGFSYTECVRFASVATTPAMALSLLSMVFTFSLSGWTYFAVNAVYIYYAIGANKA